MVKHLDKAFKASQGVPALEAYLLWHCITASGSTAAAVATMAEMAKALNITSCIFSLLFRKRCFKINRTVSPMSPIDLSQDLEIISNFLRGLSIGFFFAMMKIFGLVLTLAGSAAAVVDPMAILSCQSAYSDYTGDSDCDALVTLAKCFAVVSGVLFLLFFSFFPSCFHKKLSSRQLNFLDLACCAKIVRCSQTKHMSGAN